MFDRLFDFHHEESTLLCMFPATTKKKKNNMKRRSVLLEFFFPVLVLETGKHSPLEISWTMAMCKNRFVWLHFELDMVYFHRRLYSYRPLANPHHQFRKTLDRELSLNRILRIRQNSQNWNFIVFIRLEKKKKVLVVDRIEMDRH